MPYKDPEKAKAYKAAYYLAHREDTIARANAYYAAHREEQSAKAASRYAADPEPPKARAAAWHAEHREVANERRGAYYRAHRHEHRVKAREWEAAHTQEIKAYKKAYYAAHRTEILARVAAYNLARPDKRREGHRKSKALRRGGAVCTHVSCLALGAAELAWQLGRHVCYLCGTPVWQGVNLHMDHVVPVARGGVHCADNLRPACATCNASKKAQTLEEYLAG